MILCDIDGVLAIGPDGRDTKPGQAIYPTFRTRPSEVDTIRVAGIPFCIVTAKVEVEAQQILSAINLLDHVDVVVGADRLFWPTLALDLSARRIPSVIRKSVSRRFLPRSYGSPVVMIEDRRANLEEMLLSRSIDFGILVPPPERTGQPPCEWFDLEAALRLARAAVQGRLELSRLEMEGVKVVTRLESGGAEVGDRNRPLLLELPSSRSSFRLDESAPIASVGTLKGSRREVVSWARTLLRWSRSRGFRGDST